jgi:glycosyltransferase involved in cell wall biosynthesis
VIRRPRAVWLVDSADPSGATIMAGRRMDVLRHRLSSTMLALSAPSSPVPVDSPLRSVPRVGGLVGEARIARADLVITTSERTLASAAARLPRRAALVHFLHTRPEVPLRAELFLRRITAASRVVVPLDVDPADFARRCGLAADQVLAADDFTPASESLFAPGGGQVILAAGRLPAQPAVLDLINAFRLAQDRLHQWQLRIAGWGPGLDEVRALVDRHRLSPQVLLLGARHDLAVQYLDAGLVVRLDDGDVNGLSVLEALAAGVPVAASRSVPAARRHIRHATNGWLLDRTDPVALAEQLRHLAEPAVGSQLRAGAAQAPTGLLTSVGRDDLHRLIDTTLDVAERSLR